MSENMSRVWELIFQAGNVPFYKKITVEDLRNPNSEITKLIIYLYSMDSFIYTAI